MAYKRKYKNCIKCRKHNVPIARVMAVCDNCFKKYKRDKSGALILKKKYRKRR